MIGIVIGSFGLPAAVELNVAAIRAFNHEQVPILVHDDSTPVARDPERFFHQDHEEFELHRTSQPMGHVGGDVNCFITGLEWARQRGFRYLIKLSQRFIFTEAGWVQRAIAQADADHAITMGQPAAHHGTWPWPKDQGIRSECVMMRVETWAREEVYQALRNFPHTPEMSVRWVAENLVHPGQSVVRWRQFGPSKSDRRQGVLWHDANPESDYLALASQLGVELNGYHNHGWNLVLGAQYRL